MDFDRQPRLDGQLVSLRPLRSEDYDALFNVASDPLVWAQHPANDRYKAEVFRQFFDDAIQSGGALVAHDARTGEVIGSSRFHNYQESDKSVEIGWSFLARKCWGGPFNGEMKQLMLTHAFAAVDTVLLIVGTTNMRSQRAVEKLGAVQSGTSEDPGVGESFVYALKEQQYLEAVVNNSEGN